jgi:thiol:disulfide interchange protein DsbD
MPCVFPVLAIKALAFAQHGHGSGDAAEAARARRVHRASGLAYTAGVVVSCLGLGAILLGLRSAGEQLGWGFQLQNPLVVTILAALFTLIGLNLAGLFEFTGWMPDSWASVQLKHPVTDAFLTGVLATAVASPCTAPFMGASLGLAITLPAVQALSVFAAIGLGMALPYMVASWVPALARLLPRPGPWMETFKQLMAFPMLATVVWLVWVLGQQTGIDGAAAVLAWLVALSMLAWAWQRSGRSRPWLVGLSALLWVAAGWNAWTLVHSGENTPAAAQAAAAASKGTDAPNPAPQAGTWQPWSAERMSELRQAGHTLLVDYTAAWCVTCQYNKRTVLTQPELLADLARAQVVLLRADWTRRDPTVTAALAELGRTGVPTYAVYRPGQPPQVLSELPSVDEIRQVVLAR